MTTFDFQDDNGPVPIDDLAHEIWAVAQLAPGEGIVDAVERIATLLARYDRGANMTTALEQADSHAHTCSKLQLGAGETQRFVRVPDCDKRVANGDDFAGDAWLDQETQQIVYGAVGHDRNA